MPWLSSSDDLKEETMMETVNVYGECPQCGARCPRSGSLKRSMSKVSAPDAREKRVAICCVIDVGISK